MVFQSRFRRADGEYRWHLTRVLAMRDASGKISMWIGSNTDIHEQKETEDDLRRANEDLQQFAYSASPTICKEPIRKRGGVQRDYRQAIPQRVGRGRPAVSRIS